MSDLPAAALRVEVALRAAGSKAEIVEMPASTRTAEDAAAACGCEVGQIVKSLIFRGAGTDTGYLVLTSGSNRVNEKHLGRRLDVELERADADFVRAVTGYSIGGVPPVGHTHPTAVVMDDDLSSHDVIWAAAGTPRCVFATTPAELLAMTGATAVTVT